MRPLYYRLVLQLDSVSRQTDKSVPNKSHCTALNELMVIKGRLYVLHQRELTLNEIIGLKIFYDRALNSAVKYGHSQ